MFLYNVLIITPTASMTIELLLFTISNPYQVGNCFLLFKFKFFFVSTHCLNFGLCFACFLFVWIKSAKNEISLSIFIFFFFFLRLIHISLQLNFMTFFIWHNDKIGSYHQQQKVKPDKYVKTRLYLLYLLHLSSFLSIRLFIWQK